MTMSCSARRLLSLLGFSFLLVQSACVYAEKQNIAQTNQGKNRYLLCTTTVVSEVTLGKFSSSSKVDCKKEPNMHNCETFRFNLADLQAVGGEYRLSQVIRGSDGTPDVGTLSFSVNRSSGDFVRQAHIRGGDSFPTQMATWSGTCKVHEEEMKF